MSNVWLLIECACKCMHAIVQCRAQRLAHWVGLCTGGHAATTNGCWAPTLRSSNERICACASVHNTRMIHTCACIWPACLLLGLPGVLQHAARQRGLASGCYEIVELIIVRLHLSSPLTRTARLTSAVSCAQLRWRSPSLDSLLSAARGLSAIAYLQVAKNEALCPSLQIYYMR